VLNSKIPKGENMIFVGKNFQKMTDEEIKSSIRGDKQRLGKLKKELEANIYTDDEDTDVEETLLTIGFIRETINAGILELQNRGVEFDLSKSDVESATFQTLIPSLSKIVLKNREDANEYEYEFDLSCDDVSVKDLKSLDDEPLYTLDKCELLSGIAELYIGEWKKQYNCSDYGAYFYTADAWSVTFTFDTGEQRTFGGMSAYPYNFFDFIATIDPDANLPMCN
jgi:hypothetical protein